MKYTSTRSDIVVTASEAIINGLADDGGLYVPLTIPKLVDTEHKVLNYQELSILILSLFFSDFEISDLYNASYAAYNEKNFSISRITNIRELDEDTSFLELYYGKTSSFKDQALSIYPYLLNLAMKNQDIDHLSILTATSGDTGKAAMEAVADIDGLSIAVLYPYLGTSEIQKLQMQSQIGDNVLPLGIDGNFDDAQKAVKDFFLKHADLNITSANSINIARLLPQVIYYFDLFNRISTDKKIDIYVPTGNFGNILAAYIAKQMGLAINKLIVCTNDNNVLYEFFKTGVYDISQKDFKVTYSPSMDILVSSNLERLLYFVFEDKTKIIKWMSSLNKTGRFELSSEDLAKLNETFSTQMCSNDCTYENIKKTYETYNVLIDPHTATAIPQDDNPNYKIIVSTASPYKFPDLYKQLFDLNSADDFEILEKMEEITKEPYPHLIKNLRNEAIRFDYNLDLDEIETTLFNFVKGRK